MHPECATAALGKHSEISSCLCSLHDPKSIFLTRHRQVVRVVAGHLQEDAAIRPAFVGLSSGMEEARTKAETCRDMLLVANQMADRLQAFLMRFVHLNVSEQSKIIACLDSAQMRLQISRQRFVRARSLRQLRSILVVGEELHTFVLDNRLFGGQGACFFVLGRQVPRGYFAGFYVRLIEGVNSNDRTGY